MVSMQTVNSFNKIFAALCLLAGLLSSTTALAVNITVKTSHNPVALDDSFHLIYEADSNVDDDPDFTPLEQYFDILNSSQSTNMRLINGNYSLKKTWDLAVMAKDVGSFTVPPISFGSDKSPSIRITVKNSVTPNSTLPNGQASIPAKIFLESSIDKKQVWVQEQIIYSVRLLRTVSITGASLSEPTTSDPDAIIQRLGEDSSYQTTRNGIRYDVIERRYVIFPQHSGRLTINAVTFEGRINATQPRTIFDQFRMSGQLKRLRSPVVNAKIKPKPAGINTQDWLPASQLNLSEEWSEDIEQAKTGEPLTRTITLVAAGQAGVLLPDIKVADIDGLKQYPDKPVTTDRQHNNGITGARQIKIAIIPTRPGRYTLPAIKLPWWNTRTNRAEVATLPATTLVVTGAAPTPAQTPAPAAGVADTVTTSTATMPPAPVVVHEDSSRWKIVSLTLALGWLATLVYLFASRRPKPAARPKVKKPALAPLEKAVIQASKNRRGEELKNALLAWAQARWPEQHISSLTQLARFCPPALQQEIEQLNKALYNPAAQDPNGVDYNALASAFRQFKKDRSSAGGQNEPPALQPLYKT
ncbi:MAG TPA: protein BatD [Thiotrichales bacterium]|nr:protein BatD [Thiotrichales bacterium]